MTKTVGLCRVFIKDSDGHQRNIKGCDVMVPFHEERKGDEVIFNAYFPLDDPVTYIHIQDVNPGDVLALALHRGSFIPPLGGFMVSTRMVTMKNTKCKEILEAFGNNAKVEGTFEASGWMPFLDDTHNKRVKIFVTAKEIKLQTKLEKIQVIVPAQYLSEYETYANLMYAEEERYMKRY